ncbi:MAG: protein TolR [Pseudomonadota bacterium]
MSDINVVPYIDVMLVLLVIFMITTPLLKQGVNVDLPQTTSRPMSQHTLSPIIISVDKSGHYYLNIATSPHTPMKSDLLIAAVKHKMTAARTTGKHQAVYVEGDKAADYGDIVKIMALLQQAGVDKVGLITESPSSHH